MLAVVPQVTVTGAGGRTGKIVLQKLLAQPDKFEARGVVRNTKVKTQPVQICRF